SEERRVGKECRTGQSPRQEIKRWDHRLKTSRDAEGSVHRHEDFGRECGQHGRGRSGWAGWDAPRRTRFLAADRLAFQPLYYTQAGGTAVCVSVIKAIRPAAVVEADLGLEELDDFVCEVEVRQRLLKSRGNSPGERHGEFFFSGRRRHTSWPRDWSSDVCSSDLGVKPGSMASRIWNGSVKRLPASVDGTDVAPLHA